MLCGRCQCLILDGERVWRSAPGTSEAKVQEHFDPRECILALQRAASEARLDRASEIGAAEKQLAEAKAEIRRWKSRVMPGGAEVREAGVTAQGALAWMRERAGMPDSNLTSRSGDDYTAWVAEGDEEMAFVSTDTDDAWSVAKLIEFAHDATGIDQWVILAGMAARS